MTDALAEWLLRRCEQRQPIWKDLSAIRNAEDPRGTLATYLVSWRQAEMRNDDVALVVIVL